MKMASHKIVLDAAPVIVGIIGGSGSGKTWLARLLLGALGPANAAIICQDSFYRDLSHLTPEQRLAVNFDHPNALDWAAFRKCMSHLASGRAGRVPQYNFATHSRDGAETWIEPRPVIIFEGLWLLHRPAFRRYFQLTAFVEASPELCLERRIARDVAERGRCRDEVCAWYGERVLPMQRQFVDPQRLRADLTIPAPVQERHVQELVKRISILCGKL